MLTIWPGLPNFAIESIAFHDNEYVIVAHATAATALCPKCGQSTASVHSWYQRKPHDLPCIGQVVRLLLQVRRFFCRNALCPRKIFCERLPPLLEKYARRTERLLASLGTLAFALGGKEGQRVANLLSMPTGRDTLLRFIRRQPDPEFPAPEAVGVDDWAFRKAHNYGTLICDLETGHVIDLLADRDAGTVAAWFRNQPTVTVVARDRSASYAAAVSEGAPNAIQVADRWHLTSNLVDALETTLAKHPKRLLGDIVEQKKKRETVPSTRADDVQQTVEADMRLAREARRDLRKEQYDQLQILRQEGVTIASSAARTGLSCRTVNRWLAHGTFPERKRRASQPTVVDPFRAYLARRWQEGCHNSAQLHREIQEQGFRGSYATVYDCCRSLSHNAEENTSLHASATISSAPRRRYSPRQTAFLFIRPVEKLSARKQADLALILRENPKFQVWYELAQQFMMLVRERNVAAFDAWLDTVASCGSGPMKRFAAGLRSDYAVVLAALTYEWSSGPTEGHINKLKLLKRQMYGRAKLDLLRKRMLHLSGA